MPSILPALSGKLSLASELRGANSATRPISNELSSEQDAELAFENSMGQSLPCFGFIFGKSLLVPYVPKWKPKLSSCSSRDGILEEDTGTELNYAR